MGSLTMTVANLRLPKACGFFQSRTSQGRSSWFSRTFFLRLGTISGKSVRTTSLYPSSPQAMPTRPVPAPNSRIGSASRGKLTSRRASRSDDPHVLSPRLSLVSAGSCRQIGGSPSTVIFRVKPGAAVRPEFSEMIVEASAHTFSRSAASIHESGDPQMPVRYDTMSFVGSAARSEKLAYSSEQWVLSHGSAAAKLAGCSRLTDSMDRV
ncbi:hypothetical protein KL909_000976 [Ogataea angusta]|nr:hypothetical protein KL909_000976 [Ogataea angusta]